MHAYLAEFTTLMIVFSFAIITPGADFAMVIRQSIMHGRKNAIVTSIGISAALLFHASYTILGLGVIIAHSIYLFNIIKWLGIFYLIYLGFKALRSQGMTIAVAENGNHISSQSLKKAFGLGFMVNVLNPKAVLFFLSIFSSFVSATTPVSVQFVYSIGMSSFLLMWFILISVFMTTKTMRTFFSKISKWVDRVTGVVFIMFSIRLMFQKSP